MAVALVNGELVEIDITPDVISNRTFVPLRFLNEIFGANVEYDAETHMVSIDGDSAN
ncbi:copper amine oxidase N-terminal domain-containing protein [Anoxybacter fermentans]|uniref:copper amine oxidase N-terminal domain-containing protein n=1 Tax=Anoxybacter fermentans TaxID=1323375 RepID=UPI000F8E53C6